MNAPYRILEHPADLGIEAWGGDVRGAFEHAVAGLIATIVDAPVIDTLEQRPVRIRGGDREALLVRLLSEVLYLFDGERFVTARTAIATLSPTGMDGMLYGEPFDEEKHRPKRDIKAITYHQVSVREERDGVRVTVFFDI